MNSLIVSRACRVAGEMVESTPSNMRLFMARTSTGYAVLVKTPPVLRFGQIDMFSYMHSIYAFGTDSKHIPRQQNRMLSSDAPGIAKDVTYDTSTLWRCLYTIDTIQRTLIYIQKDIL